MKSLLGTLLISVTATIGVCAGKKLWNEVLDGKIDKFFEKDRFVKE